MMNCRYWIFAGSIAAALLSAAEKLPVPAGKAGLPETVSAGKAEVLNPEIRGTSLVAGTKQLQLLNNFRDQRQRDSDCKFRSRLSGERA